MYIINISVKPSENKNNHRKHRLAVASGQRCICSPVNTDTHTRTHTHDRYGFLNTSRSPFVLFFSASHWIRASEPRAGGRTRLKVRRAADTGIVLVTESHSPLIREGKNCCSRLSSPTKTSSSYFIFTLILARRRKMLFKKTRGMKCHKSSKIL